jgi:hypothetical protein
MKRRRFLRTTGGAAALALSGFPRYAEALADTRLRVGTQSATFDYGDVQVVWTHRTWGERPYRAPYVHPDPATI